MGNVEAKTIDKMDSAAKILGIVGITLLGATEIYNLISEHKRISNLKEPISEKDLSYWEKRQKSQVFGTCLQIALLVAATNFMGVALWIALILFMLFAFASFILTKLYVSKKD